MPVIQVKDKQHSLKPGQTKIGAGAGVDVVVPGDATLGVQAIFELSGDNRVVIRRASDAAKVKVNGVALVDPTPLMHGDKVEISGTDVLFSEDKKVGATQFVSAADVAAIATSKRAGPARATTATGGRLVSLVDGKEYQIPAAGITFGREAGSDVVVAQAEVSRRHATIAPDGSGYVLTDLSTNGVWVNGNRLQGSQVLARADVVRLGNEEFRFYADVAPAAARPAAPSPAASAPPVAAAPAPAPPPAAAPQPAPQPAPPPAPPPAPAPSPVASTPAPAPAAPPARPPEPPTVPKAAAAAPVKKKEPPTTPTPVAAAPAKTKGGIPTIVWLVVIVAIMGVMYLLLKS